MTEGPIWHFTPSEVREEAKSQRCPEHPQAPYYEHFGMAGGGFGPYKICEVCSRVFDKQVSDDDDC